MFCVECGKDGKIFREGLCIKCYFKAHHFTKGPEFIDIPTCSHCNALKYKNTWTQDTLQDILKKYVKNLFEISNELKKIKISVDCKEEKERLDCQVYISGNLDDQAIKEQHQVYVRLKKNVCDVCSKKFGGYHEAIIQVRAEDRDLTSEELDSVVFFVESMVKNMQAKGQRGVFIADGGEEHGGFDFFLSEKSAALTIVNKIQEKYGGDIKKSSKNIGMKDGQQLYRMTYLVRLPAFQNGDFIEYNNSVFQIKSISNNNIHAVDLSNWDEETLDLKNIKNTNILGNKEIIKEMIVVSQNDKEIQLMDSKNYKTFIVQKPKKIKIENETIEVIKVDEKTFLIPF